MLLLTDWLAQRASLSPTQIALVDQASGERISYEDWNRKVNQLAHYLQTELGLEKGHRIAVLAHNCVSYLDLCMACGKLGIILQQMNWRLSTDELAQLLDEAPHAFFYNDPTLSMVHTLQEKVTGTNHWIAMGEKARPEDLHLSATSTYPTTQPQRPELSWDDPWFLCYTGGTTGLPKAAILSHGNVLTNAINTVISWGLDCNDMAVLNAPLFHTGGLNVFTLPLVYAGGTSIVCESFNVDILFDLLEQEPVTVFFGVPTMFVMMQEHERWETSDFSRLKFVISGGAPCPMPIFEKFWARGIEFKTGYGLTEAGPNTFWLSSEYIQKKPGSVGKPLMHIEVSLVDEQDNEVGKDEVGELRIRGSHVTQGYWNNPKGTAESLKNGWLYTGDLATCDADGFYYIVGRRKDMFISGGENVYPAEIESVLHENEEIAEAAVFGVPHPKWGEAGVAVVRALDGCHPTSESIKEYCKGKLAKYKIPRRIFLVDELPKTGAGKIDKKQLAHAYKALFAS